MTSDHGMSNVDEQRYDWRLVLVLSWLQLISWGSIFYMFSLLMEPVEADMGWHRSQVSLAFSLALLAEGLVAYPVGRWIDQGHERAVMAGGSVLAGLSLIGLSQVNTLWAFHLVWVLLGASMAAVLYAPAFALLTRRFKRDFRRAIIAMTFLGGLASTVFIPLIAWLMHLYGWRDTLLVLAAMHLLLCAPLHYRFLRGAPQPEAHSAISPIEQSAAQLRDIRRLMRGRPFLLIGLFTVIMMSITVAIPAHLVPLLSERGLPLVWVVALPATIGMTQVLGRVFLYFFEARMNLDRVNRSVPLLIPAGLLVLLVTPASWQLGGVAVFVLLYGLGNGLLTIVRATVVAQYVSQAHAASLNGALGVPLAIARAAAPLLLGLGWSEQWGYTWGIGVMLGMAVLAVVALKAAQRHTGPAAGARS